MSTYANTTARFEYLDYVKAISMLLVLMAHRDLELPGGSSIIMPSFFIIAGYCFHMKEGFHDYAVKRVKRLLVPFWLMMIVYACVEVIRASLFGYGDIRMLVPAAISGIFGSFVFPCSGEFGQYVLDIMSFTQQETSTPDLMDVILPTTCPSWFLPALFSANIIFYFVIKNRRANVARDVLTMLVLLLFASIETIPGVIQFPYALGRGFFGAALMLAGRMLREADIFDDANIKKQMTGLIVVVPVFVLSMIFNNFGSQLLLSVYGPKPVVDVFILFVCGLAFTYVMICLCKGIQALPIRPVHRILSAAGRHSMTVYLWHMMVYFLGDCIMVYVFNAKLTFDPFFMECFSGQLVAYRFFMVFFTFALLTMTGLYKKS